MFGSVLQANKMTSRTASTCLNQAPHVPCQGAMRSEMPSKVEVEGVGLLSWCLLAVRTLLLLLLLTASGSVWVIEQPASSMIAEHKRFRWLVRNLQALNMRVSCLKALVCV